MPTSIPKTRPPPAPTALPTAVSGENARRPKGEGKTKRKLEGGGSAPRPGRAKLALHPRHVLRTCLTGTHQAAQGIQEEHEIQEGVRLRAPNLFPNLAVLRAAARP